MNTDKFEQDIERITEKYFSGDRAGRNRLIRKREDERLLRKKKQTTYYSLLKIAFRRCQVVNWTSISSHTSYKFRVLLNETVDSIMDDDIKLIEHLGGKRKDLDVYFSYLANYWHWHIIDTSYSNEVWNSRTSYGIPEGYARSIEGLRTDMDDMEFVEPGQDCKGFGCMFDWSGLVLIVIVIAAIAAVSYKIVANKRSE